MKGDRETDDGRNIRLGSGLGLGIGGSCAYPEHCSCWNSAGHSVGTVFIVDPVLGSPNPGGEACGVLRPSDA